MNFWYHGTIPYCVILMPYSIPLTLDNSQTSQDSQASQANDRLLEYVRRGDSRGIFCELENSASLWLGSVESLSDDPNVNPILAALLSPLGLNTLEAFDRFFTDIRKWNYGKWNLVHWALAAQSSEALDWALNSRTRLLHHDQSWRDIFQVEHSEPPSVQRTGLAIAAQMGDPDWLLHVIKTCITSGASLDIMTQMDRNSQVSALGIALFEWAIKAKEGASQDVLNRQQSCITLLHQMGFSADSFKTPAIKLCVALALHDPKHPLNTHLGRAACMASECGSGTKHLGVNLGMFESAGFSFDPEWAQALMYCGLAQHSQDSFLLGLSKRIFHELQEENYSFFKNHSFPKINNIISHIQISLNETRIDPYSTPLVGLEHECLLWMQSLNRGEKTMSIQTFKERLEFALLTPPVHPSQSAIRL